ncbi:hypothetical protein SeLEV6574_g04028 [Synchytrium endobioticum]|uniref:Pre-mRNA-splicing factor ISY1 n=1 Tax=Synchytrium endobioticum TaxID=286115 RepID=A0A507D1F1_9FUNG|nr:hypothetical protein SeLEV6574_g04028 [Synchytrium endobioticum]
MARNQEKAQSMLYRFREAQAEESGLSKKQVRRPYLISDVNSLPECDRWRSDVIREVSKKVTKIQDPGLNDFQVRDLNDEVNKLLREKNRWENRIIELGGPNYRRNAPKMFDTDGKEVPGSRGYKYFGRAKDLPGVRELFEDEPQAETKRTRADLYRFIDADYYGYRDEEDGVLLEYERTLVKKLRSEEDADENGEAEECSAAIEEKDPVDHTSHLAIPTQKDVETFILRRKKQDLLDRYLNGPAAGASETT